MQETFFLKHILSELIVLPVEPRYPRYLELYSQRSFSTGRLLIMFLFFVVSPRQPSETFTVGMPFILSRSPSKKRLINGKHFPCFYGHSNNGDKFNYVEGRDRFFSDFEFSRFNAPAAVTIAMIASIWAKQKLQIASRYEFPVFFQEEEIYLVLVIN